MITLADARRIARIVTYDPCGGLPRLEVARRARLQGEDLKTALMIAYRRGWIDFVRDYVVARSGPITDSYRK